MRYNISQLSLEEKIGQLLLASLDGPELDEPARRFLKESHAGNIIHFGNNAHNPEQVTALNAELQAFLREEHGIPGLITVDHEGGRVMRFRTGVTWFPTAMAVAAAGSEEDAYAIGYAMGEELRYLGFHLNFAPVLDVNVNLGNPVIGLRSYGDNPETVARMGVAVLRGMQKAGIMACGKHYPGHGDSLVDSHYGLPNVDKPRQALEQVEFYPFRKGVEAGLAAMMTSHILYPALESREVPATMSHSILTGLLRGEMGFAGLIVSDGIQMQAIKRFYGVERGCVEAVKAGVDLLCVGTGGPGYYEDQMRCYHALLAAARSGELPMERLEDAVLRILAAKERWIQPLPERAPDWAAHVALAQRVADASITWLRGEARPAQGRLLFACAPVREVRFGLTEGDWRDGTFAQMGEKETGGRCLLMQGAPDEAAFAETDVAVIGVTGPNETERAALETALRLGKRTIAACLGMPDAALRLPEGCEAVCLYGVTWASVRALCRVLRGEISPRGTAPVHLGG